MRRWSDAKFVVAAPAHRFEPLPGGLVGVLQIVHPPPFSIGRSHGGEGLRSGPEQDLGDDPDRGRCGREGEDRRDDDRSCSEPGEHHGPEHSLRDRGEMGGNGSGEGPFDRDPGRGPGSRGEEGGRDGHRGGVARRVGGRRIKTPTGQPVPKQATGPHQAARHGPHGTPMRRAASGGTSPRGRRGPRPPGTIPGAGSIPRRAQPVARRRGRRPACERGASLSSSPPDVVGGRRSS